MDDFVVLCGTEMDAPVRLSPRQREVLGLMARGYTEKEVARMLELSPHTVHQYLVRARDRLGARNTRWAVARALELGIIVLNEPA